jgi:hypothetical protein
VIMNEDPGRTSHDLSVGLDCGSLRYNRQVDRYQRFGEARCLHSKARSDRDMSHNDNLLNVDSISMFPEQKLGTCCNSKLFCSNRCF